MAKKKKVSKKKAPKNAPKKKAPKKKIGTPKGPGPFTADLNSIRTAIDRVREHVKRGHGQTATRMAAGGAGPDKADQLLKALDNAYAVMAAECCNLDQNCDF
jgi:hypothetical protein